jgi:predicted transcriptional regulator
VCDGGEEDLKQGLDGKEAACEVLCVVGNRPDIQEAVMQAGAQVLITGGSHPGENLLLAAEKSGVCVLASLQSTYTLLHLLYSQMPARAVNGTDGMAEDWMQAPYHLYSNDIAADWQRLYRWIPAIASQYPVVNDDLEICGALDIAKAFAANPSQKISGLLTAPSDNLQVGPVEPMRVIAEKMILTGKSFAAVTEAGKMSGLITANDLLRYYLFSGRSGSRYKYESFLEETAEASSRDQKVFAIHFPKDELDNFSEFSISIMLAAVKMHAESILKQPCRLDNGTFFAINSNVAKDNLVLTSIVSRCGENYCAFEVEVHDETKSYTKAILIFRAPE